MAPTAQFNIRLPEHLHPVLRRVAEALRDDPTLADALMAACRQPDGSADGTVTAGVTADAVNDLAAAVIALQDRVAALEGFAELAAARLRAGAAAPARKVAPGRIPDEHLAEAAALWDGGRGPSLARIIQDKDWPYHRSALHKALGRWLEGQADPPA